VIPMQLFAGWAHSHIHRCLFLLHPLRYHLTITHIPLSSPTSVRSQAVRWLALILISTVVCFPHPRRLVVLTSIFPFRLEIPISVAYWIAVETQDCDKWARRSGRTQPNLICVCLDFAFRSAFFRLVFLQSPSRSSARIHRLLNYFISRAFFSFPSLFLKWLSSGRCWCRLAHHVVCSHARMCD